MPGGGGGAKPFLTVDGKAPLFRNEKKYLAADYHVDPAQEYLKFFRLGVDGVFTDFAHTGVAARATYLRELGW